MEEELISVTHAASELGKQKSHLFKVLDRLGVERKLQKSSEARGAESRIYNQHRLWKSQRVFIGSW